MSSKFILLVLMLLFALSFGLNAQNTLPDLSQKLKQEAAAAAQVGCYERAYELLNEVLCQEEQRLEQQAENSLYFNSSTNEQLDSSLISGLLSLVFLFLYKNPDQGQTSRKPETPAPKPSTKQSSPFIEQAKAVLLEHLEEESFGVGAFSQALHLSRSQLHRKIKADCHCTPSVYMRKVRLKEANRLLKSRAGNISEVAMMVGMPNLAYFSRSFKSEFGYPPSQILREKKSN